MKKKSIIVSILIIILVVMAYLWLHKPKISMPITPTVISVPTTVKVGVPTSCTGKGICNCVAGNIPMPQAFADTFTVPDAGSHSITMTFMAALAGIPADTRSYTFDCPFDISINNTVLATLGLPAGTLLPAGVPFAVTPGQFPGEVNMAFTTVTSQPDTVHIIFGGTNGDGSYNPAGTGIYTISPTPIKATKTTPATIMVVATLQPGSAQNLVLSFNSVDLQTAQPLQFNIMFPQGTMAPNYTTTGTYQLAGSTFTPLQIPACAAVLQGTYALGATTAMPNGTTLTIGYGNNCVAIPFSTSNATPTASGFTVTCQNGLPNAQYTCTFWLPPNGPPTTVNCTNQNGIVSATATGLTPATNYLVLITTLCSSTSSCNTANIPVQTLGNDNTRDTKKKK
jgi:hypothetical protein